MCDHATLHVLRGERFAVQRDSLALCAAIGHAAIHAPAALPDLGTALQALHDARAGLDLLIARYEPQASR